MAIEYFDDGDIDDLLTTIARLEYRIQALERRLDAQPVKAKDRPPITIPEIKKQLTPPVDLSNIIPFKHKR